MRICISRYLSISNIIYRSDNQNIKILDDDHMSLENNDLSLENEASYELFDGTESDEHSQTWNYHEKPESITVKFEASQNNKPKANIKKEINLRSDVVNKTLLRAVKRYYFNKFKITQRPMVRKRFRNVRTSVILDALAKFWQEQFESLELKIDYQLMAEFMMLFWGIKPFSTYMFDKLISKKAKLTLDCLNKYSIEKFQYIKTFQELRILIVKIYNCNMDELFSGAKTIKMNREIYVDAIAEFIDAN